MTRLIWGIILIGVGFLFFGQNYGWLKIGVDDYLAIYWPIILVIVGLLILADVLKSVFLKIIIIFIIIAIFILPFFIHADTLIQPSEKNSQAKVIIKSAKEMTLNLSAGAINLQINDQTSANQALTAKLKSEFLTLTKTEAREKESLKIDLKATGPKRWNFISGIKLKSNLDLALNPNLLIKDLAIDIGAATVNADLSNLKLEEIDIDSGATTMDLRLGDLADKQEVKINSGASTIKIRLPKVVGVQVMYDGGASTKNFPADFENLAKGLWQSENYGSADHQIVFDISLGAATLNIERY